MDVVPQKRGVSWLQVVAGLLVAAATGVFVAFFAGLGGGVLLARHPLLAALAIGLAVVLLYFGAYWLMRRPWPDFAIGLLIGGCVVALCAGACGALFSGLTGPH